MNSERAVAATILVAGALDRATRSPTLAATDGAPRSAAASAFGRHADRARKRSAHRRGLGSSLRGSAPCRRHRTRSGRLGRRGARGGRRASVSVPRALRRPLLRRGLGRRARAQGQVRLADGQPALPEAGRDLSGPDGLFPEPPSAELRRADRHRRDARRHFALGGERRTQRRLHRRVGRQLEAACPPEHLLSGRRALRRAKPDLEFRGIGQDPDSDPRNRFRPDAP